MNFKNLEVDKRFQIVGGQDPEIEIVGKYRGKLSEVQDPSIIEGMIKRKNSMVAEKDSTKKAPADTGGNNLK